MEGIEGIKGIVCRRREFYNNNDKSCINFRCFDYNKLKNFEIDDCDEEPKGWKRYYDKYVQARYWYNWDTGEATWIDPNTDDVVLGRGGKRKTKNKRKCKRKSKRIFLHKNKKQI
jgi:hypothetical protein